ncbi:MAG TPA: 3-deoxy-7-phosphoheptulonate synthase [Thermoanaerobaculia bacterium]|nr:3-deoxy-7-phosphoheptulonate synthase [Thermoanaerobaculia bacterium]
MRVAIQGTRGSFSEAAAQKQWPDLDLLPLRTVADVVEAVRDGRAEAGCLAFENSLVGLVETTEDLMQQAFRDGTLHLDREILLPVHHALLGLPGTEVAQVKRVLSHPVALDQCRLWLGKHLPNVQQVSEWDTAGGAEIVASGADPSQAAIGSRLAAEIYGLAVLEDRIEDDPTNQTRFLTFTREPQPEILDDQPRKTSLVVWTDHRPGLLAAILQAFATRGINLTALQSRPERSAPWTYRFYIDVDGAARQPLVAEAIEAIEALANQVVILGSYRAWQGPATDQIGLAGGLSAPNHRPKPAFPLFDRRTKAEDTVVRVGSVTIGGGEPVLIAGPCSVESEEMLLEVARAVAAAGADMLRGGAFKPRTSPYDFQGLGVKGLKILAEARRDTGLPVVTEVMSWEEVPLIARYADMLQIGARNMQNFALLRAAGRSGKPVLLKRGGGATIDEWLHAAEYVLAHGNDQVVLCERGIRTFERATRHTLDLNAVAIVRERTHLPVLVDPSHAAGVRSIVPALALAGLAAGAQGIMVEVHPDPDHALSDGAQSLRPDEFADLAARIRQPVAVAVA